MEPEEQGHCRTHARQLQGGAGKGGGEEEGRGLRDR
jgi:hypothetical protein